jgi:HK97 family phage major capsid protein
MTINATDHIPTYTDIVERHGKPGEAGNHASAVEARHARNQHQERLESILANVERRGGDGLNADEQRSFDKHRSQITLLDSAADMYDARGNRADASFAGVDTESRVGRFHTSGGHTYRKNDPGSSWVRDLAAFAIRGDPDAAARLHRNNREVAMQTRALSTTDGAGGDFSPPMWVVSEYAALARAARVTANLVHNAPLPTGTDSINVPRVATGTAVAEQATQNTAVQNTDATTGTVTANVATLAGQQVVSLQLIEQSPIPVDNMLLQDLTADLAAKVDLYVLQNNAANKKGLLNETGTNAVTFTSASPTVALFYSKLADAVRQVLIGRFQSPTAIIMSPMRWAWLLAASDSSGRPLVVPDAGGPNNSLGQTTGITDIATGRVGIMLGLPVYVDPLMPSNLGAGTNEDRVIVLKADDSYLWESNLKADAFRETKADQLSVLLRVYEYVAFTAARFPKSTSIVAGTGLVQPTL